VDSAMVMHDWLSSQTEHTKSGELRLRNSAALRFSAVRGQKLVHCTIVQCVAFGTCTALSASAPKKGSARLFCLVRTWLH